MFPADPRELVEFRAALVVALAPMRGDPPPLLETDERRVNRALIETQQVVRHLFDPAGDPVAVRGAERVERLQHHDIEGSLHDIRCRALVHDAFLLKINRYSARCVECQHERPRDDALRGVFHYPASAGSTTM